MQQMQQTNMATKSHVQIHQSSVDPVTTTLCRGRLVTGMFLFAQNLLHCGDLALHGLFFVGSTPHINIIIPFS